MDMISVIGEWRGVAFFRDAPVGANRHSRRAYLRLGGPDTEPAPVSEPEHPPQQQPPPEEDEDEDEKEAAYAV